MPRAGLRVAVVYGGRSVEHDVSILTALQAMEALSARHEPVPVYVSRAGRWCSGPALRRLEAYRGHGEPAAEEVSLDLAGGVLRSVGTRGLLGGRRKEVPIDVVLPAAHGTDGEDGALQGLLELAGVPYAGSRVGASAAAMDKAATKALLREAGLPVLDYRAVRRERWQAGRAAAVEGLLAAFEPPVYVKPLSLGSSIGVARCAGRAELEDALEVVFELDGAAIVEPSLERATEINCAVLGRAAAGELRASVCEQPLAGEQFLSFEDKYLAGAKGAGMKGAARLIPAPISEERTREVQELARRTFRALGCSGVARVDFLVAESGAVYVNEANTIPGSFSFYLWEPAGLAFPDLLDDLLDLAFEEHRERATTTRTFASALLSERAGAKR